MKNTIIIILVLVLVGLSGYFLVSKVDYTPNENQGQDTNTDMDNNLSDSEENENEKEEEIKFAVEKVIGESVEGRDITAYEFGHGTKEIVFVGGIHGGYSWNTSLLGFEAVDYFTETPSAVPQDVKVTVIPVLNPDGLNKTVGTSGRFSPEDVPSSEDELVEGRFNANDVDLNRNFDCDWQASSKWQSKTVSGGDEVFSEPESKVIKNYIKEINPEAVIVWYSAAGGVFSSSCHNGVMEETLELTNTYADASGYLSYEEFNFYEITGDMVNWLASEEIPAISVLLSNHQDIEWNKNKAGIEAVIKNISQE